MREGDTLCFLLMAGNFCIGIRTWQYLWIYYFCLPTAESSQASNIIPPPTEFAVLPRRTSLPTTIYTQARRPPPRRPTVGARPSQVTLVIPSNNQVTVNKNTENGSKEVDQEVSHYSIPSNRPLLSDPNVSPQYEVVFNPDHLALLLKNDAAIEQEKEEKTSVATES